MTHMKLITSQVDLSNLSLLQYLKKLDDTELPWDFVLCGVGNHHATLDLMVDGSKNNGIAVTLLSDGTWKVRAEMVIGAEA